MTNKVETKELKYGDKFIRMEGVIVEVHEEGIAVDLKGRLGYLRVPNRMVISDYPFKVGQEVAWNMSFIEQLGPDVNTKYVSNHDMYLRRQKEMAEKNSNKNE